MTFRTIKSTRDVLSYKTPVTEGSLVLTSKLACGTLSSFSVTVDNVNSRSLPTVKGSSSGGQSPMENGCSYGEVYEFVSYP